MRVVLAFLLMLLPAMGLEGTVWYDAAGKVAWVEGPAAEKPREAFVPEWQRREIERRERMRQPGATRYRGPYSPWDSTPVYGWGWSGYPGGYGRPPMYVSPWPGPCVRRPGVSIIIRR
jgi:hypothetical protein